MDLFTRMATFVRVVEAGSLSAASKQLRVSAAAVSRQIATLESELGVTLLVRTTRRMTVTTAGQDYFERCQRVLRAVDDAQSVGDGGKGDAGLLRISVPITIGAVFGAALLRPLLAKYPHLRLDVRVENRIVDLVLEDVDVAIRVATKPPLSTELVAIPLSTWTRILVASPAYLKRHGEPKAPVDLATHFALSTGLNAELETWNLKDGTATARVGLKVRCACSAGHVIRDLALAGDGVALLPEWFVAEALRKKLLRRVLPSWETEAVMVHALYRAAHRNEPRVRRLVDSLRAGYAASERLT